jgi:hypothetical protein
MVIADKCCYEGCPLENDLDAEELCILHSKDPDKDHGLFKTAFQKKRDRDVWWKGIRFPIRADFREASFPKRNGPRADFSGAEFLFGVDFSKAKFEVACDFSDCLFRETVKFDQTEFREACLFDNTKFEDGASFKGSNLYGMTRFRKTLFVKGKIIDFREVTIEKEAKLIFESLDLGSVRFLGTHMRRIEFTGVTWTKLRMWPWTCDGVYDEKWEQRQNKKDRQHWSQIERVYRELKQNYQDRQDWSRVGDFHYGEKKMRRTDPATPFWLRCWLWIYALVGGYGEKVLPPSLCFLLVLGGSTAVYIWQGLEAPAGRLNPHNWVDWLVAGHYSLQVMTLLKPVDLEPIGISKFVHTFASLAGPLFIGLFALALRQRLKR